jgi:phage gpG-like protein
MSIRTNISQLPAFRDELKRSIERMPMVAGGTAVAFFKENFRRQGFLSDGTVKKWKARNKGAARNKGRALLIDSGTMRRDIRVLTASGMMVVVGTTVPYAEAHNDGSDFKGTVKVPGHTRKGGRVRGHKRGGVRVRTHKRDAAKVSGHTKKMDVKIPQRQFIGESSDLMSQLEQAYIRDLEKSIGKYLT